MMQTARCTADLPTTKKVAIAAGEPMRVLLGKCKGEVCCPCGTVTGLNLNGVWPPLDLCQKCCAAKDAALDAAMAAAEDDEDLLEDLSGE